MTAAVYFLVALIVAASIPLALAIRLRLKSPPMQRLELASLDRDLLAPREPRIK